jgi:hypothetical protein
LYGGNEYNNVKMMSYTLSHEYGHHFTYYQLVQKEQLDVEDWKTSSYAKARGYDRNSQVHTGRGDYRWDMAELMAEDYVQLFGSENALSQYLQMNTDITTPFDTTAIFTYWTNYLGSTYKRLQPMKLYLTDYTKHADASYDLELSLASRIPGKIYVKGEGSSQKQVSALMGEWPIGQQSYWIKAANRPFEVSGYMLNNKYTPAIKLQAVQYNATGFNRGSGFLTVPYQTISSVTTDKRSLPSNSGVQEAKEAIKQAADSRGIPAEILKAIAYEKSGMKQWNADGTPFITADGGIGLMGINPEADGWKDQKLDANKLKADMNYNIEAAADYLVKQWDNSFLPMVNDHEELVVEDWYFALLAYDGVKKENIPSAGNTPFQEKIFTIIRTNSKLALGQTPTIEYTTDPSDPAKVELVPVRYEWPTSHETSQHYPKGVAVYTKVDTTIETAVGSTNKQKLLANTPGIIEEAAETADPAVHYLYYKVRGHDQSGYVPSTALSFSENVKFFTDINRGEVARAVAYLQLRGIINGYGDDTYRPNQLLYRRHAAKLLVEALQLKLPEGYQLQAKDIKPGDLNYEEMKIAEAHGLIGQGSDMRPNEFLSRNQLAAILDRAFGSKLAEPTTETSFSDVPKSFWNYPAINKLSFNKITIANPYRLNDFVSRSQFALFLERTLKITQ